MTGARQERSSPRAIVRSSLHKRNDSRSLLRMRTTAYGAKRTLTTWNVLCLVVEQLSPRQTRLTIWWEGRVRISSGAPNLDLPRTTVHFWWNQDAPESRITPGSGMRAIVPPIYARRQIAPTNPQSWALKRPMQCVGHPARKLCMIQMKQCLVIAVFHKELRLCFDVRRR